MSAAATRLACPNAGDDVKHAKRHATHEIIVKGKVTGPYCHTCWWDLTTPAREVADVKAKAEAAKLRAACIDCRSAGRPLDRPAPHPGPRCATDHRAARKAARKRAHETRAATVYSLSPGDYDRLYAAQGGRCAWPKCRATGEVKKLAIDHWHGCCPGPTSCGKCVRGLLCGPHNRQIGMNGDDPEVFAGVAAYLRRPPAQAVLLSRDVA